MLSRTFISSILAVGLLSLALKPIETLAAASCELKQGASLPISYVGSVPTVPVRIENRQLRLLFDTGSITSSIEGRIATGLGYTVPDPRYPQRMAGAGGEVTLTRLSMPLALDRMILGKRIVMASDPETALYRNAFDGILGESVLEGFDEEFDPTTERINFFSRQHCRGKVVYWANEYSAIPFKVSSDEQHIEFPVKVNGQILRGILDTGNSHTSMRWQSASDHFGLKTTTPGVYALPHPTSTADGRTLATAQYTFETMELGDLKIHSPVVNLLPAYSQNAFTDLFGLDDWGPELIVGMDVLHRLRFYVSRDDEVIYFTVPDLPTAPHG